MAKKCTKKVCCKSKVAFLPIRPIVVFHRSPEFPSPLSITRFYILFLNKLLILSRASPLALAKSIYYRFYMKVHFWFMLIIHTCATRSSLPADGFHTPKRVVISHLLDAVAKFLTGVKFSLRYNNWGELTPVWLAPAWHFVMVSCKQLQSHWRESEWTLAC